VLGLNAVGAALILGIFFGVIRPVLAPPALTPAPKVLSAQEEKIRRGFPEFFQAKRQFEQMHADLPNLILGFVVAGMAALMLLHLREIPRAVELTEHGVRLEGWLGGGEFIPYEDISEVYLRPAWRHLSAAICIKRAGFWGKTLPIARYAFPDAAELYRRLQGRMGRRG
jgi:hypothetical protein